MFTSSRRVGRLARRAALLGAGVVAIAAACSRQATTATATAATAAPVQADPGLVVDPSLVPAKLAPGKGVSFAAFGDTDQRAPDGQRRVARALAAVCAQAGCDFVLLLGDNFYPVGVSSDSDPMFQSGFEVPYADVPGPFLAVLGNHDYAATVAGVRADRALHEVEYTKRSKKWRMPGTRWHEVRGPVELFGLDTTVETYGQGGAQAEEVEGWLKASSAPWKIALGHHPYFSNGPHGNAGTQIGGDRLKAFLERVVCGKTDLYLAGHDHNQQWLLPTCQGTEQIVSGASASSYELTGNNPARFQSDELGFFYARVTEKTFTGYFIDAQGKVEFTRSLTK